MSDNRAKVCSILLKMRGKTRLISLHDFASFSGQSEDAGLYRARIDGCWHCPDGKYTAIGPDAVAELVRIWLTNDNTAAFGRRRTVVDMDRRPAPGALRRRARAWA